MAKDTNTSRETALLLKRLEGLGPGALTDQELLRVLLRPGREGAARAGELIRRFRRLSRLSAASPGALRRAGSLSRSEVARIAAAFEMARRGVSTQEREGPSLAGPAEASRILIPRLRGLNREVFGILPLDTRGRSGPFRVVSVGSLSASIVHPREVFAEAITEAAASIILAHNHPSGDPAPSAEDIAVTRKLVMSGELMDIPVVDHLIVGSSRVVSLAELGLLEEARPAGRSTGGGKTSVSHRLGRTIQASEP